MVSFRGEDSTMATTTTEAAAPAVRLNAHWQAKYRQRAQQFLLQTPSSDGELQEGFAAKLALQGDAGDGELCQSSQGDDLPRVYVVGRSGVGKSSLLSHLLHKPVASISHFDSNTQEQTFEYQALLCIREIPGYDGWHTADTSSRCERFRRHFRGSNQDSGTSSSHSNGNRSSHGKGRQLNLDEFVKMYDLFEDDTKAIIFVVNSRITPDDEKLMGLAVQKRKFFCIVRTHADNLVKIADKDSQSHQLLELEEQLRRDLSLLQNLNVRIFILSIPLPEGQVRGDPGLKCVMENTQELHFPLLQAYLSQPRGLHDELQIHGFVREEVYKALEPFMNVKKRHQALDFTQNFMAGLIVPIAGPVMVSFLKTLKHTLGACSDVGLVEDGDKAMKRVDADVNKHRLSAKIASQEGLVTAVHDSLIHIFGDVVFEIAIAEVVTTAADTALSVAIPGAGSVVSAAHLPGRYEKIGEKLAIKACMLHELWIMQNITGLLGKA